MTPTGSQTYTISRMARFHSDLLPLLQAAALGEGLSVPKWIVLALERELPEVDGEYLLNDLLEIYRMSRDPRRKAASKQLHLYMRPETDSLLRELANRLDSSYNELRLSLVLDHLTRQGYRLI